MIEKMSLGKYRELFRDIPCPTYDQMENFVKYVSSAHSWYKHLPREEPGAPFVFFLDPHAGMDRLILDSGHIIFRNRDADSETLHYSMRPTKIYRERYGYLNFSCQYSTVIIGHQDTDQGPAMLDNNHTHPLLVVGTGVWLPPLEIIEAGMIRLTRDFHSRTNDCFMSKIDGMTDEDANQIIEKERNIMHERVLECISKVCGLVFHEL